MAQLVLDGKNAPDLFDGDCLKVTAYRFYSPNGVTNDTMGVLPTLLISQENTEAAAASCGLMSPASRTAP